MKALSEAGDAGLTSREGTKIIESLGIKIAPSTFGARMSNLHRLGYVKRIEIPHSRDRRYILNADLRRVRWETAPQPNWRNKDPKQETDKNTENNAETTP